jgi:hypothetical protein
LIALSLLLCPARFRAQPRSAPNRVEEIRSLSKQLRWHDESDREEYLRTRDEATQRLLGDVDGFVMESFQPDTSTADLMKAGLDALLGYRKGDSMKNEAFSASLPTGRFLIIGVDLRCGGPAIPEDVVSFRAYKESGDRFVPVAHAGLWDYATYLDVKPVPAPPIPGELWFLASAEVPPLTPPTVAMRLYAFDGNSFRAVWTPKNITAEGSDKAVELTTAGFVIDRLFDPTGVAALSPTVVIHEQYILTPDGPRKTNEWETER